MKRLWICILLLPVLLNSCKDKNKINPDAEEDFSFYADGEYFYYPQEKGSSLGVRKWQTLSAGKEGTTGYGIFAYSTKILRLWGVPLIFQAIIYLIKTPFF